MPRGPERRKGGRRQLPEADRNTVKLETYVSPGMAAQLQQAAAADGMALSSVIRRLCADYLRSRYR